MLGLQEILFGLRETPTDEIRFSQRIERIGFLAFLPAVCFKRRLRRIQIARLALCIAQRIQHAARGWINP